MGQVYKAFDPGLNRTVALKTLLPGAGAGDGYLDRLYREAQAVGGLQHPHIVTIYDLGEIDGLVFIAMEHLAGQSLDEAIAEGTLSFEGKIRIIIQMLEALQYAHSQGVVHRDIKPSNVHVLKDGSAKLLDFGLARMSGTDALTMSGAVMGTPAYMSPEQVNGQKVDGRSDVFSTGAVAYEMFTRRRAFTAETFTAVMMKVLSEDPAPMGTFWTTSFPTIELIVKRALAKSPADRYQSADEMREDLLRFLQSSASAIADADRTVLGLVDRVTADATAFLGAGRVADARTLLEQAVRANPDATQATIMLTEVEEMLAAEGQTRLPAPPPGTPPPLAPSSGGRPASAARQSAASPAVAAVAAPPRRARTFVLAAVAAAALAAAAFVAGSMWQALRHPALVDWVGERLGGSAVAFTPRLSPDGQTLAFIALNGGLSSVAVLKPSTGSWTILTRPTETTRGVVQDLCWSPDGSRIFFDAVFDVPQGIYSVPALGGDVRLILPNAMAPQTLPDGTLLVTRINEARVPQLHHFWLDTGRIEPLPALVGSPEQWPAVRPFPDGKEVVYYGRPAGAAGSADALYVLELASGKSRQLAPAALFRNVNLSVPLAVTPDGKFVRFGQMVGNVSKIVEVPREGSNDPPRLLMMRTTESLHFDLSRDGWMYTDQSAQPLELLSWSPASGQTTRIRLPDIYALDNGALPLPDGRALIQSELGGRDQVMVLREGRTPEPFVDTNEETSVPVAAVGQNVALLMGDVPRRKLVLASMADGHVQRQFAHVDGNAVTALAGTPDGKTVYYVIGGMAWSVPADESAAPVKVHEADDVAVDPGGQYLVLKVHSGQRNTLVRTSLTGEGEQIIPVAGDEYRLVNDHLSPAAIAPDGRIAVRIGWKDTWFWPAGILDPRSGAVTPISKTMDLDMMSPGWTRDGRVMTFGVPTQSAIWRFRPSPQR